MILDLFIEFYHHLCFPVYEIPLVKRQKYIKIDRHLLPYLSFVQKIYCVYCGYVNGVLPYWTEIGAQTEKYWCGIKHQSDLDFLEPHHHADFVKYNDQAAFVKKYK